MSDQVNDKGFPSQRFREARRNIVFTIVLLIALAISWHVRHVLGIIYVSGLMAVVLNPVVNGICRVPLYRGRHMPKGMAVGVLVIAVVAGLTLFFWLGLPPVLNDFRNFLGEVPGRIPALIARLKHIPMADKIGLDNIDKRLSDTAGSFAGYVFTSLPSWAEHIFDILTCAILTVYFILEGQEVYKFFLSLAAPVSRNRLANTLLTAEERVSRWLLGQLALMAIIGVYSLIAFRILNVRYFLLLGVLMGLTNIIPVAGNLSTILLVALVAAMDSWGKAGLVLLVYAAYVQIENAILIPRIMRSSVDLMGITVLTSLLFGTAISGIPGALVAVPTAAIIVVFANEYLVQHEDPNRQSLLD